MTRELESFAKKHNEKFPIIVDYEENWFDTIDDKVKKGRAKTGLCALILTIINKYEQSKTRHKESIYGE